MATRYTELYFAQKGTITCNRVSTNGCQWVDEY